MTRPHGAAGVFAFAFAVACATAGCELPARSTSAISHRATFDVVRERLGPRVAMCNLVAACGLTVLTLLAEIGGVGLVLELATGLGYRVFVRSPRSRSGPCCGGRRSRTWNPSVGRHDLPPLECLA